MMEPEVRHWKSIYDWPYHSVTVREGGDGRSWGGLVVQWADGDDELEIEDHDRDCGGHYCRMPVKWGDVGTLIAALVAARDWREQQPWDAED